MDDIPNFLKFRPQSQSNLDIFSRSKTRSQASIFDTKKAPVISDSQDLKISDGRKTPALNMDIDLPQEKKEGIGGPPSEYKDKLYHRITNNYSTANTPHPESSSVDKNISVSPHTHLRRTPTPDAPPQTKKGRLSTICTAAGEQDGINYLPTPPHTHQSHRPKHPSLHSPKKLPPTN